jgi:hypothetical protein
VIKSRRGGTRSTHGRDEKCIQNFGLKNGKEKNMLRPRSRLEDNIRMDLKVIVREVWTGFIWFRMGMSDRLL